MRGSVSKTMLLASVKPSISASIRPSVNRPMGVTAGYDPASNSDTLQVFSPFAYAASPLDSLPVLSSSVGTVAVPRGQRCYLADGTDDYIAVASLTGSETVISKEGTSTVSIAAGRINLTAGTVWNIVLSNGSTYYCTEESGTTAYDSSGNGRHGTITNATLATFHSTSASVLRNWVNDRGYTLSGAVIIPRNEVVPTQDAAGGALQFAAPIALSGVMEVPCWTGNGSNANVNCGAAYVPASANFMLGFWYRPTGTLSNRGVVTQGDFTGPASRFGLFHLDESSLTLLVDHVSGVGSGSVTRSITKDVWSYVEIVRSGSDYTLTIAGSSQTVTNSGTVNQGNLLVGVYMGYISGQVAGLSITTGGVTRYPLFDQCGPGSSNTNRDFYIVGSDGSATLVSAGIVNGTVSAIYANRCPFVRDWCIENGGGIAANGSFIPGRIGSSLDAAGNAKTLSAGEHRNPFSRFDPNNWSAPSLVNIGSTASDAYAPSDMAGVQTESVADTRFASEKRYAAFRVAQTGSDKTNAESWAAG
jgi:hypothetical protein